MAFINSSANRNSQEFEKCNDKKINMENDKENSSNIIQNLVTPKKKSSRISLLKSLDPYTSYLSDKSDNSPDLNNSLNVRNVNIQQSSANKSFDLLNFDISTIEENFDEDMNSSLKIDSFDMFQNDFMVSKNRSLVLDNISNISKILDESNEDNDDVATDNLIGLSPVKRVVDRKHFDILQQYHEKMKSEWREKEMNYQNMIENAKKENDEKINDLLSENDDNVSKMKNIYLQELHIKQLENEEIEARMRCRHNEILDEKESELKNIQNDLESLCDEIYALECDRVSTLITCDAHIDTIHEVILANESDIDNLRTDARQLELTLSNYVSKINKCEETLDALKENESNLRNAIDTYEKMIAELRGKVEEKEKIIASANEKNVKEYRNCEKTFQRNLKRLEVQVKHLECVQGNLEAEIDLRVKERDEMREILEEQLPSMD